MKRTLKTSGVAGIVCLAICGCERKADSSASSANSAAVPGAAKTAASESGTTGTLRPPGAPAIPSESAAVNQPPGSAPSATTSQPTTSPTAPPPPPEPIAYSADFLGRGPGAILRVVNYNVHRDDMFPDKNPELAAKFVRLFRALNADIWAIQEVQDHTAEQAAAIANEALPLPREQKWYAFKGARQIILSRYPLKQTFTGFSKPTYRDAAIAVIDLPDRMFLADVCVLNNHFKCCDGEKNDPIRQLQADANVEFIRDARTAGGVVDLAERTAFIVCGDFNLVGGRKPLETTLTGDIVNEEIYGPDAKPDWDNTDLTIAELQHNGVGSTYTWRDDTQQWPAGRLDYIVYSDSVIVPLNSFILNTAAMSDEALAAAGLQKWDVALDNGGGAFDHFPLVVDFAFVSPEPK